MATAPLRTQSIRCPDGATVVLEEFSEPDRGRATVVFLPAMGVPLAYYRRLLGLWAECGRHVVGVEPRGLPDASVAELRRAGLSYTHLVRTDLPAVLAHLQPGSPDVILVGHSLGGQIALLAAGSGVAAPVAVVTLASGTSSSASQQSRARRLLRATSVRAVLLVTTVLGYWPGDRFGFGGRQPGSLMRDWAYEARHGRYRLCDDATDYEAALATLTLPMLLVDLVGDSLVPARAVDHLVARLPADAERLTLPAGPRPESLHHVHWARQHPHTVVEGVEKWLTRKGL